MLRTVIRRGMTTLAALLLVTGSIFVALPAAAQTATVSQTVSCTGSYIVDLNVLSSPGPIEYSSSNQTSKAKLGLLAGSIGSCFSDGWTVSLVASNLVAAPTRIIDASNVRAASLGPVIRLSGMLPLPTRGNAANTPLSNPVMLMKAARFTGIGLYAQEIDLSLVIPGGSQPGTYSTTLTATVSVGPT